MSVRMVAVNLDWDAAKALLVSRYRIAAGSAFGMLTGARDEGSFKTPDFRVTRTSTSPLRFEIYEHDWIRK